MHLKKALFHENKSAKTFLKALPRKFNLYPRNIPAIRYMPRNHIYNKLCMWITGAWEFSRLLNFRVYCSALEKRKNLRHEKISRHMVDTVEHLGSRCNWRYNMLCYSNVCCSNLSLADIRETIATCFDPLLWVTVVGLCIRVIISSPPRGNIRALATISRTLVLPALWCPTTTTCKCVRELGQLLVRTFIWHSDVSYIMYVGIN